MSTKPTEAIKKGWRKGYPPGTPCGPMRLPICYSLNHYEEKNRKLSEANKGVSRSRAHNPAV